MRILLLFAFTLMLFGVPITYAQKLNKCDTTKAYWTFENDNNFLYVKLVGNAVPTDKPTLISVNKMPLQVVIINKATYVVDGGDNTDPALLLRYAQSEGNYFSGSFKTPLNIHTGSMTLPGDKKVGMWYFDMPSSISQSVKAQLFANVVIGDKIFSLSGTQFNNQELKQVGGFLLDVIATLTKVENSTVLSGLCNK